MTKPENIAELKGMLEKGRNSEADWAALQDAAVNALPALLAEREAFLTPMDCGHAKTYQRFDIAANPLCAICQVNQLRTELSVGKEAIEALKLLVYFTDTHGNCCFCDQWKDPESLQHSGACRIAQHVMRRIIEVEHGDDRQTVR